MFPKNKLSIVIATYNEQQNIAECLDSVKNIADEIIIIDGQSSDQTVEICKKYKTKVFIVPNKPDDFHANKQLGIEKASGDWILQLDADERVSKKLSLEIKKILNLPKSADGYFLPRSNWFLTRFLKKGGAYPDYVMRLFKKTKGSFVHGEMIDNGITTSNVHAQIKINGTVGYLKNNLIHYGDRELSRYFSRLNRYTTLEANNLIQLGVKPSFYNALNYIFFKPTYWFLKRYLRHKGFVDGFAGFLFALLSSLHYPMIYFKIWERQH